MVFDQNLISRSKDFLDEVTSSAPSAPSYHSFLPSPIASGLLVHNSKPEAHQARHIARCSTSTPAASEYYNMIRWLGGQISFNDLGYFCCDIAYLIFDKHRCLIRGYAVSSSDRPINI